MLYLNARLIYVYMDNDGAGGVYYGLAFLCYALYTMMPRPYVTQWRNWNTYIFVLPMACGLIVDAAHQIPGLTRIDTHIWNTKVVNAFDLMVIIDSGLVFAFLFTLAFRGVISIYRCYWLCAAGVACICLHLVMRIPSLL